MVQKRKTHSEEFKARVALEAIKGVRTLSELSAVPASIRRSLPIGSGSCWRGRRRCSGGAPRAWDAARRRCGPAVPGDRPAQDGAGVAEKKAVSVPQETRCGWIQAEPHGVSIVQPYALVGLARSTYYDEPVPGRAENLALMRLIDELYLQRPFYGVPRMTDWLQTLGHPVDHKRVARLMRVMGLQAVLPGPHTSRPQPAHRTSPYLLHQLVVVRPNQVWCADITSVPTRRPCTWCGAGLVQPRRAGVGTVQHAGHAVLAGGVGAGVGARPAGDLQHRPRGAVYGRRLHRAAGRRGGPHQHG